MASAGDLPDPLERSNELTLETSDDLISQLAGEEIARLLAPDADWQPVAPRSDEAKAQADESLETPVEELTKQLDQLFEEIRAGRPADPIAFPEPDPDDVFVPAEPVLVMRRRPDDVDDSAEGEPRHTLIAPLDEDPLPAVLRPLAWINAPVMEMGSKARLAVSLVSLASFVASIWALVYVLMLRAQNG